MPTWQSVTAPAQAGHAVATQYYCVTSPSTGKRNFPPKGRCWIYNEKRMKREIVEGNIYFGADGNAVPRVKKFLADSIPSLVPSTLWPAAEIGTATAAKKQLLRLFPDIEDGIFETPKPESLLAKVFSIATQPGDLILDPFLGSGTSAATAHKMGRRYIGIDVSPQSFKFSCQRLDMVVSGERSGISGECKWHGGGAYRAVNLHQFRASRKSGPRRKET